MTEKLVRDSSQYNSSLKSTQYTENNLMPLAAFPESWFRGAAQTIHEHM